MNTLVQGFLAPANDFQPNCRSRPAFLINGEDGVVSPSQNEGKSGSSSEGEKDHSDAILKFINIMLMEEEDLENRPYMLHDSLALQATEKSLHDLLTNSNPHHQISTLDTTAATWSEIAGRSDNLRDVQPPLISPFQVEYPSLQDFQSRHLRFDGLMAPVSQSSREKKHRYRGETDSAEDNRSTKQLASDVGESEPLEMFDKVLLCSNADNHMMSACEDEAKKKWLPQARGSSRGRPRGGKKQGAGVMKEVVDLRSLLMQCAQAVASYDSRTVNDLLARIRQHSSPHGDGTERLAYYFAKALETRLAGTGTAAYTAFTNTRISAAEILRGYQTFIKACPFKKMSNFFANKSIRKLAHSTPTLHIIDFGILYGFQWPCLIQTLSERPGGPPMLRITGIDFPQPGFRPAERVADTGRRLARYCERFGVPFEYNAIAQKWETIKLEDLKINKNELLVVNSLYRLQNVPDETVAANSPRDAVLSLIKKINPELFIHGVVNGTYNTPFFMTRFREVLFHYSSLFDMYEATVGREEPSRVLFEEEVFGKDATNIIACEGTERVDRPETYKQWQMRNVRAGLRQLALDEDIVRHVRQKVKREYHKDFSVDEDGKWMLQGWKGRVLHATSYWKPAHN